MPLGKGGSSQSQNNQYSGNTAGTSDQTQVANPTGAWNAASGNLAGNLGTTGLNTDQTGALDWMKGWAGANPYQTSAGVVNNMLMPLAQKGAYQSAGASPVMSGDIAGMLGKFQDPYTQQVVDATTADAQHNLGVNLNDIQAQYGGQYGNGRAGVATGQAVGDASRALDTTIGGLRSQGFNTALSGATNQAGNDLSASNANAGYTMANNQFNTNQQNTADQRQASLLQSILGNVGSTQDYGTQANQNVYNAAGGGNSNLMAFLNSQVPAFGQTSHGSTTGTASGTSSGGASGKNGGVSLG